MKYNISDKPSGRLLLLFLGFNSSWRLLPSLRCSITDCRCWIPVMHVSRSPDTWLLLSGNAPPPSPGYDVGWMLCCVRSSVALCSSDAPDGPQRGHGPGPWRLSRISDGTPRTLSPWAQVWMAVLDVLLDWAHHHLLWRLCGMSALFVQKDFVSP